MRDHPIDIQHLPATLRVDMARETVSGTADITFVPLRASLGRSPSMPLPASTWPTSPSMAARRSRWIGNGARCGSPPPGSPSRRPSHTLRVTYTARPKSGLYFFPGPSRAPQAWNYGKAASTTGGCPCTTAPTTGSPSTSGSPRRGPWWWSQRHSRRDHDNADGTRTFHWTQDKPIPNYLIALQVGDFARVALADARLPTRTVPLAVWTMPGTEKNAAYAFGDTPRMVEYFSRKFGYEYPWPRYDQVLLRDFSGAMETTGAVGFAESFVRGESDPVDSGPSFAEAYPAWTGEDTIAHELAHHWFGDLVTCRSLASLWLNESFASFAHLLWHGEARGEDDLTYQRWRYLNRYLDYVRTDRHRPAPGVRPLRAHTSAMYQEETTYLKGALVLHMLRHIVGDADFFRGIALYLQRHAFGAVESVDLEAALREVSGRNLRPFFEDWIRGGGRPLVLRGQPSLRSVAPRRDLNIRQVHADLPFENDFHLPVQVKVVTAKGARVHEVAIDGWTTDVSAPVDGQPLVRRVRQGRVAGERDPARAPARGDAAPARWRRPRREAAGGARGLRAVRAAARSRGRHAGRDPVRRSRALGPAPGGRGGPRTDGRGGGAGGAPRGGGGQRGPARAARGGPWASLSAGGAAADAALRRLVEADTAEDVVAVAAAGVGTLRGPGARAFLVERQLPRDSRWWDAIQLGVVQGLSNLQDSGLGPVFERYLDPRYSRHLRQAALEGWIASAPDDPRLPPRLRELTRDRNLPIRAGALDGLGRLHRAEDVPYLREYAAAEVDENLAVAARGAADAIEAFTRAAKP